MISVSKKETNIAGAYVLDLDIIPDLFIIIWTYLQLPLRQWGAGNVYLLVLSSWKLNIAENPIAVMGL